MCRWAFFLAFVICCLPVRADNIVATKLTEKAKDVPASANANQQAKSDNLPLPIEYDIQKLPAPVQEMRQHILEAAKTGDIEALRPLLGTGKDMTIYSYGGYEGDLIKFPSFTPKTSPMTISFLGRLINLLETGYVHVDAGTPNELYVWPYFLYYPINKLSARQMVELFRIININNFEDMKERFNGNYNGDSIGIKPNGKWVFFDTAVE